MGQIVDMSQCPNCASTGKDTSQDNLIKYVDGGVFCHACGYSSAEAKHWVKGQIQALPKRGLSEETCKFYGYKVGQYTGSIGNGSKRRQCVDEWVCIAEWHDSMGKLLMQKIKTQYKEMKLIGSTDCKLIWGLNKFYATDKLFVTLTEGEEDAMSIAEVQGCQFPVGSVGSASSALEVIQYNLTELQKFKHVVLAFDNDDAGKKAIEKILAAEVFEPGRVKIVDWPLKDANEMLKAGRKKDIIDCLFRAKIKEPSHIVTVGSILDQVLIQPSEGIQLHWPSWNKWTYGIRMNEITTLVGPSGCGKTEIVKDIVSCLIDQVPVGIFSFEQSPADTIRRYVGAKLGLKLQKPGEKWEPERIKEVAMTFDNKVFLYDFNGKIDLDDIFYSIRYMAKVKGCKWFVIDNLKSLKVVLDKVSCSEFAVRLKAAVKDLNIHVMLVSHVNKSSIKQSTHVGFSSKVQEPHKNLTEDSVKEVMNKFQLDWENGRMPTTSNIEGGNDIEAVSDYVVAISRNKQAKDDKVKRTIKLKLLKEGRIDSDNKVYEFNLYRNDLGVLEELEQLHTELPPNIKDMPF